MDQRIQSSISGNDGVSVESIKETGGLSESRHVPESAPPTSPGDARRRLWPKLREAGIGGLVEVLVDALFG